ncbi:MAG: crosslink repair DNA glycosylase YcaQ family protein [Parvibaculum sp.]
MTKAALPISDKTARHLLLSRQGLSGAPTGPFDANNLKNLIHQLGYVQLDSINTVERAHHMILHSRADNYRHLHLQNLHEEEASLFEHWTHDACLIPTEFYPYWHQRFQAASRHLNSPRWQERIGPDAKKVIKNVRARIKREGPLMARDFEDKGKGAWWGWGPSKTALEFLWRTGDLAIARRDGFQKVYDLTERVVDESHRVRKPGPTETRNWKCTEALKRLGVATPTEIAAFWASVSIKEANAWVTENLERSLVQVAVHGKDGSIKNAIAFKELEDELPQLPKPHNRLRLLSPFDPVLRDRKRAERLFGFDYRIEVFVPEKKRQYGYYVLPLLEGDRFTGRTDLKVHRKEGRLEVKGLWLEPGINLSAAREAALRRALSRLAKFTGVTEIDADAALQHAKDA